MSILDQLNQQAKQGGQYDQQGALGAHRDYAQPLFKLPVVVPIKPTLGTKLGKVAEMYELELLCFDDALKAAEKAFTQHIKHDIAE